MSDQPVAGVVQSLWRYPVKSMMGEAVDLTRILESGLQADRAYALVDKSDGKVATAKNPRKWPHLFAFRAACVEPLPSAAIVPPIRITLPDGGVVTERQPDIDQVLSKALNRDVTLAAIRPSLAAATRSSAITSSGKAEEYWPDVEGLDIRDAVTDFELLRGTFFDCATIHVLAATTIERLRSFYPEGRFEVARFRPNIVLDSVGVRDTFVEDSWIGRTMAIGDEVRLKITGRCGRCVMTTLPQGDLPGDRGILRTAVQHHRANVGAYATVLRGGTVRRGDRVTLDAD